MGCDSGYLAAAFRGPVPRVVAAGGLQTPGCCSPRSLMQQVQARGVSIADRVPAVASRHCGSPLRRRSCCGGGGGGGAVRSGAGTGRRRRRADGPRLAAGGGSARPGAEPCRQVGPQHLEVGGGFTVPLLLLVVRQDVEQVLRRHANINVPALARIAKLVKRSWVQFHLRLTSMSDSVRVRKRIQRNRVGPTPTFCISRIVGGNS